MTEATNADPAQAREDVIDALLAGNIPEQKQDAHEVKPAEPHPEDKPVETHVASEPPKDELAELRARLEAAEALRQQAEAKYQEEIARHRATNGRQGAELKELRAKLETVPKEPDDDDKTLTELFDPDVLKALERKFGKRAPANEVIPEPEKNEEVIPPSERRAIDPVAAMALEGIQAVHPDVMDVYRSDRFREWLPTQSKELREVMESDQPNVRGIVAVLSKFKSDETHAKTAQELATERAKKLASAPTAKATKSIHSPVKDLQGAEIVQAILDGRIPS